MFTFKIAFTQRSTTTQGMREKERERGEIERGFVSASDIDRDLGIFLFYFILIFLQIYLKIFWSRLIE